MKSTVFIALSMSAVAVTTTAFQLHSPTNYGGNGHANTVRTFTSATLAPKMQFGARVNIDENTPREIMGMDEWCVNCGVQKGEGFQLTLTSEDGRDVGVVTAADIPAETPFLFVPSEVILSSGRAREELGLVKGAEDRLNMLKEGDHIPQFYLFLKVLREYELGDQSAYFPWLNSLPRYYSNGASMSPFCYECLPPLVGWLAKNERIKFNQFFQALKYVDFLSPETKADKALAKWAFSVVYTRKFRSADGDVKIVPMADMFNHETVPEIDIRYDENGNCYGYTTTDIPAGSPLRMSYSDHTDLSNPTTSHFFARYGFLDDTSRASFCKLLITRPTQQLINMGYDHSKMLFYTDTGAVAQEVWDVFLYLLLERNPDVQNPDVQRAFYEAHMNGDYNTKQQYHEQYYAHTSGALVDHIDTFLGQIERMSNKGLGSNVNDHPRLPLILSHNEFVRQTFLNVRSQLV